MMLRPELIRTMFAAIKNKYGSMETFFKQELGMGQKEIELLKEKYTG